MLYPWSDVMKRAKTDTFPHKLVERPVLSESLVVCLNT
jgi:hypothetical protein